MRAMLDPTEDLSLYQLRQATMADFAFAEALTHDNMVGYYRRHNLVWRGDLFLSSWRESENFILQADGVPIGMMRVTEEHHSLHIRDVQIAQGYRGRGAGTFLLNTAHRWARARGLAECQLRVFVDNPAARLYVRMGYRPAGPRLAQLGAIRHMVRRV
jgi:GNAT superfamily N-acetyltransferase